MAPDRFDRTIREHVSPAGIYVHIPFCQKKCFYCDFYSIENQSRREEFLEAIISEIQLFVDGHERILADTVFFGGGTPSLLRPEELERILAALNDAFAISDASEFTMECNPGTIDTAYLSDYRSLGVNRLSFGVQSFHEDELRFLERIHGPSEAMRAVQFARSAGFDNVNIDLMYALPKQTNDKLLYNLQNAVELAPDHISAYSLIVEPGTPLFSEVADGKIVPAVESVEAGMYEIVMEFLEQHGYTHYEISNYAKPGHECKHNLKYWNAEEYAGFGPSAHSYLEGQRWWNVSSLSKYVDGLKAGELPVSARETLDSTQLLDEFVLLHLRQGVLDTAVLRDRFGITIDPVFIDDMLGDGYWVALGETLRLTRKGFRVCDEISETLLSRHSSRI
jgi:oxygen-independent coproporphyrinogen III oxidase